MSARRRSPKRKSPFQVKRHGEDIRSSPVFGGVNPNITYNPLFREFDACVNCGLDLWAWWNGTYPVQFKAKVIAYYNLRNLVKLHTDEAVNRASRAKKDR